MPWPSHIYLSCLFLEAECILRFEQPWAKQPPPRFTHPDRTIKQLSLFSMKTAQKQEKCNQEIIEKLSETATGVDLTGSDVKTVKHV